MASKGATECFPQYETAVRRFTEQHLKIEGEPLHLAAVYAPRRFGRLVTDEIFLLEVISSFAEFVDQSEDLFESTFLPVPGLGTGFDRPLHLFVTTPRELELAIEDAQPLALEFTAAIARGDYRVVQEDSIGRRVLRHLLPTSRPRKKVVRG